VANARTLQRRLERQKAKKIAAELKVQLKLKEAGQPYFMPALPKPAPSPHEQVYVTSTATGARYVIDASKWPEADKFWLKENNDG
jgi:hypothetical protein